MGIVVNPEAQKKFQRLADENGFLAEIGGLVASFRDRGMGDDAIDDYLFRRHGFEKGFVERLGL